MTAAPTFRASQQDKVVAALLVANGSSVPALELARALGVSTRTVRNYVTAINEEAGARIVRSSRAGYAIDLEAFGRSRRTHPRGRRRVRTPTERLTSIVRVLATRPQGVDAFRLAEKLHVSDSTLEGDLTKARALLLTYGIRLRRQGPLLQLEGPELAKRRVMRQMVTEAATSRSQFVTVRELGAEAREPVLPEFKRRMTNLLAASGLAVNEGAAQAIVTHVAIMVDRVRHGYLLEGFEPGGPSGLAQEVLPQVARLIEEDFAVKLPHAERLYLGTLLEENVVPHDVEPILRRGDAVRGVADYVRIVRRIVARVNENYLVDLDNDRFVAFLGLHTRNLVARARRGGSPRLPLGPSIKDTHPLIYEIAVFIARELELATGVEIAEDEIALISFHVGALFERIYARERRVRVVIVVPVYYDVHVSVRELVDGAIAGVGEVDEVLTDPGSLDRSLDADLVVTTAPLLDGPGAIDAPVVQISPLPRDDELESVRSKAAEAASAKRRARVVTSLVNLIEPQLFENRGAQDQRATLERMAASLQRAGCVADGFLEGVLERERMSPTSLSSGAAIPHAMAMDAERSGIAIHVPSAPIEWAGEEVSLVAMFAFSSGSRESFADVFEGLIRALSSRPRVMRLVEASDHYERFIAELLDMM